MTVLSALTPAASVSLADQFYGLSGANSRVYTLGQLRPDVFWCGTSGGTANALTLSPTPAITAYAAGQVFRFLPSLANTSGTVTIAVSGLAAKSVKIGSLALPVPSLATDAVATIVYDGTDFQLLAQTYSQGGMVSVQDYGAIGDGSTDDTAAIQAAIDAASANNGGRIWFPPGFNCKISSTLTIAAENIVFETAGWGGYHTNGSGFTYSAKLSWYGANGGTMVEFAPVEGASNPKLVGCGNQGLGLDGRDVAGYGLIVKSHNGGRWNFHAEKFTIAAVTFDVVDTLGDATDCQMNRGFITVKQLNGSTGDCVQLLGESHGNFSSNEISFDLAHENGRGILFSNTDNNVYPTIRIFRAGGGTGVGMELMGSDTALLQTARDDLIIRCNPGAGGIIARGTSSYTYPSENMRILHMDDQSSPTITIETGASLWYTVNNGVALNSPGAVKGVFAASQARVVAERANVTTESVRIDNGASDHIVLVNAAGEEWSVAIDSATGDLRFLRSGGAGVMQIYRKLRLFSQTTATTATAGAQTLPANPQGFLEIEINGTTRKIPFYAS